MSEAPNVRKQPTEAEKRQILEIQESRCLYCQRSFGSALIRKETLIWLRATWDHFVPFSYSQNNSGYNFVAACQVCNGLKGSLMFATIEEVRAYILPLWEVREMPELTLSEDTA